MTLEMQQLGVDVPELLLENNAASRVSEIHSMQGEWAYCSQSGCNRPNFQTLGVENSCFGHYATLSLAVILTKLGLDPRSRIGVARYSHPASSDWHKDFAWLKCDLRSCGAEYVERHTPETLCHYCLDRARKSIL